MMSSAKLFDSDNLVADGTPEFHDSLDIENLCASPSEHPTRSAIAEKTDAKEAVVSRNMQDSEQDFKPM